EDVNIANKQNYTALHMAVKCAHEELVMLLLSHGADREAKTVFGKTPLMMTTSDDIKKRASMTKITGYLQGGWLSRSEPVYRRQSFLAQEGQPEQYTNDLRYGQLFLSPRRNSMLGQRASGEIDKIDCHSDSEVVNKR
ncbi:MAG: ankyrin repeat domain-containing protein, partial [Gammaproteobacteria bacterium]